MLGKYSKIIAGLVLAIFLAAGCTGVNPSVYAVVDGEEITREEFNRYLGFLSFTPQSELSQETRTQILQEMTRLQVFYAEAIARGFEANIEDATKAYQDFRDQKIASELFVGNATGYYSLMQELDLTEAWIINMYGKFQVINNMIDEEGEKVEEPSDREIEQFYEMNKDVYFARGETRRVRHVLINDKNFPDASSEELPALSKGLAQEIYQRLVDGEDFAKLALEYSQDGSAKNGGDIGFVEKGDVVKEFGDLAFQIKVGEVAEPVESQYGWHVLEVTEIKEPGFQELDDAIRTMIADVLYEEATQKAVDDFLAGLIDKADISIKLK